MTFAAPLFLWGLLCVAIPIAVHLFQFRRYRKVYFSNVERLDTLQSESRRHSVLRQWAVLLMRCLAIVFIVLAFARPTLRGNEEAMVSTNTVVSVFVDNSFSMANSAASGSQIEVAKQKAREIASAYQPGDRFQLLTCALAGKEYRWLSRDEFLDAVDGIDIIASSRRLSDVAKSQSAFMRQSGAAGRHAYLISDFQLTTADLTELPADSMARFTLVPIEGVATDNLYVDTLLLDAPAYFVGGSVTVESVVCNGGSRDVEKLPVRLIVNNRERAIATIDIPAGSSAKATMRFTIDSAGWIDGRVEITDYPVTFDDRYHFTLQAGQPIAMLLSGEDNDNLRRLFADDPAFSSQSTALPPDLAPFTFILLNEVAAVPSGQAQALASWVSQGGTLAIVPPAGKDMQGLDDLLALLHAPRLGHWTASPVKASQVDFSDGLYQGVFNGSNSEMEMPLTRGHYALSLQDAAARSIVTFADGNAMLCRSAYGEGNVYLFATPLTTEWTDFVSQALFVPTLYNMALYSRPRPTSSHTLGDRSPITLQGSYPTTAAPPELTGPDGLRLLPDLRRGAGRTALLLHDELQADGIYLLADDEHLAFNHPRAESKLQYLSADEISEMTATRKGYSLVAGTAKNIGEEIIARRRGTALWRWCIVAALAALLAESLLLIFPGKKKQS